MKPKFVEQAAKGHDATILEKIWKDWAFASYAFNKSLYLLCLDCLPNCYLKAHYPAEYMAAVLSNNM
jgi:DNA polymerase-3 subunit alpha